MNTVKLLLVLIAAAFALIGRARADATGSYFIENIGQWPDDVLMMGRAHGYNVWILEQSMIFDFDLYSDSSRKNGNVLKLDFLGSKTSNGIDRKAIGRRFNYIKRNKSYKDIQAFDEATMKNIYNQIDLRVYFEDAAFRYDFIVRPGADISNIRIKPDSNSRWAATDAAVEFYALGKTIYRSGLKVFELEGSAKKPVKAAFKAQDGAIAFEIAAYDNSNSLIIDPIVYSAYLGSAEFDAVSAVKALDDGSAIVCGTTGSMDFPTVAGAYSEDFNGTADIFVSKIDVDGKGLSFSTFIGGGDDDRATAIDVDASGNIYIAGSTFSADFPVSGGAFDEVYSGNGDGILIKLSQQGDELLYSTFLGGSEYDEIADISLAEGASLYFAGKTYSSDFPTTPGAYNEQFNGDRDIVFGRLNQAGDALLLGSYLGSDGNESSKSILYKDNRIFLLGVSSAASFPVTNDAVQSFNAGNNDIIACAFSASGSELLYSTFLGGSSVEEAAGIEAAGSMIYIAGTTESNDFPVSKGAISGSINGAKDICLAKIDYEKGELVFSTYIGGNHIDNCSGLALDRYGNSFISGSSRSE
jgi:hypothetical protein